MKIYIHIFPGFLQTVHIVNNIKGRVHGVGQDFSLRFSLGLIGIGTGFPATREYSIERMPVTRPFSLLFFLICSLTTFNSSALDFQLVIV